MAGALERLLNKNLSSDGVKKKNKNKNKVNKKKRSTTENSREKRPIMNNDEVTELQQKILERKQAKNPTQKSSKSTSFVKKKNDYEGFDTSGLTPGLAPVGFEEDSDSEDDR